MKLKHNLVLAAFVAALGGAMVANAADEKPAPAQDAQKTENAKPAKRVKPHNDMLDNKQGVASTPSSKPAKKPFHDYQKEHK